MLLAVEDSGCIPRMFPCARNAAVAQAHRSTSCGSKDRTGAAPSPSMEIQPRLALSTAPRDNLVWRLCKPERARALRQGAHWEPLSSCLTSLEFHVWGRWTLFGFTKESEHLNKVVPPQPRPHRLWSTRKLRAVTRDMSGSPAVLTSTVLPQPSENLHCHPVLEGANSLSGSNSASRCHKLEESMATYSRDETLEGKHVAGTEEKQLLQYFCLT